MKLRDYQDYAVNALWDWFRKNPKGHPVIKMPTGTGKSLVIAELIRQAMNMDPRVKIMMLTMSQDLIEQNHEKLVALWPTAPVGVYSAGLNKKEHYYPITYAGIASAANKPELFGKLDLILVDECDRVPDDMRSQYRKFFKEVFAINPNCRVIGLTATDWRTGSGRITESENALFTSVAVDMCGMDAFNWFVAEAYLTPLTSKPTKVKLDVDGVKIVAGEYDQAQLDRAVNKRDITEAAVQEALEVGEGRRKWLTFCTGIKHAIETCEVLNYYGIEARVVHSKDKDGRVNNIKWYRNYTGDKPIALVNADILTVGFDDPGIDLILMLRPTASSRLWVQMLGRGTRPLYAPGFDITTTLGRLLAIANGGKQTCMVLDYANNIGRLGPINDPVIPVPKGKGGPQPAPVKECPHCGEHNHASARFCGQKDKEGNQLWGCGSEFPEVIKIDTQASSQNVQAEVVVPIVETFRVDMVNYTRHLKNGAAPMLKVSYYCGPSSFDEYICLQHPENSFAERKARKWWNARSLNKGDAPRSVVQALELAGELKTPTHISVHVNTKYPSITDFCYDGTNFGRIAITNPSQLQAPKIKVDRTVRQRTSIQLT